MANGNYDILQNQRNKNYKTYRSGVIFVLLVLILFALIFYLKDEVYETVSVSGLSMSDTLDDGDLLVVNKKADVSRGDIVVFYYEGRSSYLIKRVIGLSGDTIWSQNGFVYRLTAGSDGEAERLDESYLKQQGITEISGRVTVPEGCMYVLGDNRGNSTDSRAIGTVNCSTVYGVVTDWSLYMKDSSLVNWYKTVVLGL